MSGGYFDYKDVELKSTMFGYQEKRVNVLEDLEISELTFDLFDLLHVFDLYKSCDSSKERYLSAKTDFKKKWLDNRGVRVKRIVDGAIQDLKRELYETYGFKEDDF